MKVITLEDGTKVEISDESYEALQKAVQKPVWKDVVNERMPRNPIDFFDNWCSDSYAWLNNEQSQKEFEIYLHMLLWKETYDKDFVPDWKDISQEKYYVYYNRFSKRWVWDCVYLDLINMQVYVSSEEKAEQMIKDLKSIGVL